MEVKCVKCLNLLGLDLYGPGDCSIRCKIYGPDADEAAKACARDGFKCYHPLEKEPPKFTPGNEVWVVERENGHACEVSGFLFLAEVADAVIATPRIYGANGLKKTMAYHIRQTVIDFETSLVVFPAGDCYTSREDAVAALETETGEEYEA